MGHERPRMEVKGVLCRCCSPRGDSLWAKAVSILGKDCFKAIQAPDIRVSIMVGCFEGGGCQKILGSPSPKDQDIGI